MPVDALKQRLIGAVALLLLGTIAWFSLLSTDNNPVDPVDRTTRIPQEPDIKAFSVPEPVAPKDVDPIGSERDSRPVAQSGAALPAPPKPEAPAPRPAAKPEPAPVKTPVAAAPAPKPVAKPAAKAAEPAPAKPAEPAPAKSQAATAKPAEAAPAAKSTETFQLDQHGLPVAWVVQVGSFSTQANADKIKQVLQDKGFKAYTQAVKTAKGTAIKVYVGPKLSRERADAQKKSIDQALEAQKISSMVVRFPVS